MVRHDELQHKKHAYHETYIVITEESVKQTQSVQLIVASILHHLLKSLNDQRKYKYTIHPHEVP